MNELSGIQSRRCRGHLHFTQDAHVSVSSSLESGQVLAANDLIMFTELPSGNNRRLSSTSSSQNWILMTSSCYSRMVGFTAPELFVLKS